MNDAATPTRDSLADLVAFIQSIAVREMGRPFALPDLELAENFENENRYQTTRGWHHTPESIVMVMIWG